MVLCGALELNAKTIVVPRDHRTIQTAVKAASPGDTIIVEDGVYHQSVNINKSHLIIKAKNPRKAVLDGKRSKPYGFFAEKGRKIVKVVIQGFEIRNFKSAGVHARYGGGDQYESWIIKDNYIHHAVDKGVVVGGSGHTIHNNEIAFIGNDGEAAGVHSWSNGSTISDNIIYVIRKNGIRVSSSSKNQVKNNLIAYTGPAIAINLDHGGNVVMNNYIFSSQKGIIPKHSRCTKGVNRLIQNTVVETTEANLVLGENIFRDTGLGSDCLEVYNNVFAKARKSLIKDTKNRTNRFKLNYNYYDNSFAYIMPNANPSVRIKSFKDYQQRSGAGGRSLAGFDKNSITGASHFVDPYLGPQLHADSPVLRFEKKADRVKDGLGSQVGARLARTLPVMFKPLKMNVQNAGTFSDAKNTIDGVYATVAKARKSGTPSIIYKLGGSPKYNVLWMTPARNYKKDMIKRFALDVATNDNPLSLRFKNIYTGTVSDQNPSAHFYEFPVQSARFIRVRFLDNFGGNDFKVDDIWVARNRPTDAPGPDKPVLLPPNRLRIESAR